MSLNDSFQFPKLFLDEDINENLFITTNLSDSLNDILSESKKESLSKPVKFVLTKEESTPSNLLQKKTLLKLNEQKIEKNDLNGGRWSKDEQRRFAEAVLKFGNDWKKIQNHISSRNITQVRSHAQKFLMKLKENRLLQKKGMELSLSWTKVMNYLRSTLSYDELKEVLFSVEQTDSKKLSKKKSKKAKKNGKNVEVNESSDFNSNCDTNWDIDDSDFYFESNRYLNEEDRYRYKNIKTKIIKNEEDEEVILQKLIECFNPPSGEIILNTSFEEISHKDNDFQYKFPDIVSI
jgi:SHAQKYF class myb-like DNA-binding protein